MQHAILQLSYGQEVIKLHGGAETCFKKCLQIKENSVGAIEVISTHNTISYSYGAVSYH